MNNKGKNQTLDGNLQWINVDQLAVWTNKLFHIYIFGVTLFMGVVLTKSALNHIVGLLKSFFTNTVGLNLISWFLLVKITGKSFFSSQLNGFQR